MDMKAAIITIVFFGTVIALTLADKTSEDEREQIIVYAEQYVECLTGCHEKYGKDGYKKEYPQKENECKLTCKDKYSADYGSYGFYPEKNFECKQRCDELYGKQGFKHSYPEKHAECHQRCGEKYGFRKQIVNDV